MVSLGAGRAVLEVGGFEAVVKGEALQLVVVEDLLEFQPGEVADPEVAGTEEDLPGSSASACKMASF